MAQPRLPSTRIARVGPTGGGLGLATFLLGDVTQSTRFIVQARSARATVASVLLRAGFVARDPEMSN